VVDGLVVAVLDDVGRRQDAVHIAVAVVERQASSSAAFVACDTIAMPT
jgi:hypothetical protein